MKKTRKARVLGSLMILLGGACGALAYQSFYHDSEFFPLELASALTLPIFGLIALAKGKFPLTKIGEEMSKLTNDQRSLVLTGGSRLVVLLTLPAPIFTAFGLVFLISGKDRSWFVWLFTAFWAFAVFWIYRACQRYIQKNQKYGVLFTELLKVAQWVAILASIVFGVILYHIVLHDSQLPSP